MKLVLAVLGSAVLSFVVFIIVAYILLRIILRRIGNAIGDAFQGLGGCGGLTQPRRIHLVPLRELHWEESEKADEQVHMLEDAGFKQIGNYGIDELDGVQFQALIHEEKSVYGIIYEHESIGSWVDMVSYYQNGNEVTFSNSKPTGLDRPAGSPVERLPDANADRLLEKMLNERPDNPLAKIDAGQFKERFEKSYADEMDWRINRGGPTEEEIRRYAEISGTEVTDEVVTRVRTMYQQMAVDATKDELREEYLKQSGVSGADWERQRDRIVFVYGQMDQATIAADLMQYFEVHLIKDLKQVNEDAYDEAYGKLENEFIDIASNHTPREAFVEVMEKLPEDKKPEKLIELTEPVEADVYLLAVYD